MKTPLPFQDHAIRWAKQRDVSLLCLEQGLGKTLVAMRATRVPAIVACPAFLQFNWYDEAVEVGLSATIVRCQADLFHDVDVYIMSFHFLVTLDLAVVQAEQFIVDEFHYAKSLEAKRTKAVVVEIECTPRVMLLSGTPIPSRPVEIYPVLEAIGAYTRGYYSFVYRFCNARKTDYGLDVNGASNLEELADIIAPYMLRFTKKQVLKQLPPKIYRVISLDVQLPPEEKAYDLEYFKTIRPDIAFEALSTVMRMHAALKFPLVCEIVDFYLETEKKLIVFAHHKEEMLFPLIERYEDAGHNPAYIVGGMSIVAKKDMEKKFQQDPSCRIIIIGIKAGGVGLTLTAANRVVLAESSWVPGDIDQAADRAHRIGQVDTVNVDIVTIRGSIDEYQLRRALEKLTVTEQLLKESVLPMPDQMRTKIQALRDIADELEELLEEDDEEEEEEAPKPARRGRGKAAPARRRGKAVEEEEEEEDDEEEEEEAPKPARRGRGKAAPARRRGRKAAEEDDEEEEEEEAPKPARRGRGKAAPARRGRKAAEEDDEEEAPKPARRGRGKAAPARGRGKKKASPFDEVRAKASELMAATDRATLLSVLEAFECTKVSELEEGDYENFIAECDMAIQDA